MRWLINLLKKMKADKVQREADMLNSGEYDRKIKQEEILAKARAKKEKLRKIREKHRPTREIYGGETPETKPKKKKQLTIGM